MCIQRYSNYILVIHLHICTSRLNATTREFPRKGNRSTIMISLMNNKRRITCESISKLHLLFKCKYYLDRNWFNNFGVATVNFFSRKMENWLSNNMYVKKYYISSNILFTIVYLLSTNWIDLTIQLITRRCHIFLSDLLLVIERCLRHHSTSTPIKSLSCQYLTDADASARHPAKRRPQKLPSVVSTSF